MKVYATINWSAQEVREVRVEPRVPWEDPSEEEVELVGAEGKVLVERRVARRGLVRRNRDGWRCLSEGCLYYQPFDGWEDDQRPPRPHSGSCPLAEEGR